MNTADLARLADRYPLPWEADAIGGIVDATGNTVIAVQEAEDGSVNTDLTEMIVEAVHALFGVRK